MSFIMPKSIDTVNRLPGDIPSAEEVFEAIHQLMHLYRTRQYKVAPPGLTHLEGKVLGFFARHPGATQSELAAHSGRDKGQVARLVGSLRDRALLDADPDADDRRNIRLRPTAEGHALLKVLQRHARKSAEKAAAGLDPGELQQLAGLLARLRDNLEGPD